MLKFEHEITDTFRSIHAIGKEIEILLDSKDFDDITSVKILELYKSRKPYFDKASKLIESDRNGDGIISSDIDKWQKKLKPLIEHDKRIANRLSSELERVKSKIQDSASSRSLLVYSRNV